MTERTLTLVEEVALKRKRNSVLRSKMFYFVSMGIVCGLVGLVFLFLAVNRNDPHEHVWGDKWTITVPATCVAEGKETQKCLLCPSLNPDPEGTRGILPDPDNHALSNPVVNQATCTEDGTSIRECLRDGCGHKETQTLFALGHNLPNGWTLQTAATDREDGCESRICTRTIPSPCGHTEERPLYATGTPGLVFKAVNLVDGEEQGAFITTAYSVSDNKNYLKNDVFIPAFFRPDSNEYKYFPVILANDAFRGNPHTTSITFTKGSIINNISEAAFAGCTNLESIVIPESVEAIRDRAFADCIGLKVIYYGGENLDQFKKIDIGAANEIIVDMLKEGKILFYSEDPKPGCWRWVDGVPTAY